jgi:hypothetical protein
MASLLAEVRRPSGAGHGEWGSTQGVALGFHLAPLRGCELMTFA